MNHKCPPNDDPAMHGCRSRNDGNGRLRMKRGDTQAGTIEQHYGVELNVRRDTRLDTLRERAGVTSIEDVLQRFRR